jgi:hypothetical protein
MIQWASRPLSTPVGHFVGAIRSQVPVRLIATLRANLQCRPQSRSGEIESDPELADFDQVPLTDDAGRHIEAIFVRGMGIVPLREDMFMASNASLLSFLESVDRQRFRLLVDHDDVAGLVTLSDIQKLPVYAVLFSLVIAIEMLLLEWIRKTCRGDDAAWLAHLTRTQRGIIEGHWKKAVEKNVAIDRLSCASFGQEITAAAGLGLFRDANDWADKVQALEELRHQVCHAVAFAPTPELALTIPLYVRDAQEVVGWLQEQVERI